MSIYEIRRRRPLELQPEMSLAVGQIMPACIQDAPS
jgi:hypothetical protein